MSCKQIEGGMDRAETRVSPGRQFWIRFKNLASGGRMRSLRPDEPGLPRRDRVRAQV